VGQHVGDNVGSSVGSVDGCNDGNGVGLPTVYVGRVVGLSVGPPLGNLGR